MDKIIFNALEAYYNALEKKGYMADIYWKKLLVLIFYRDFVFGDYRGFLSKEDYLLIEKALECIWGTVCLIPYTDYLKMGKLHLGEITELAQRVKAVENTEVLKVITDASKIEGDITTDIVVETE